MSKTKIPFSVLLSLLLVCQSFWMGNICYIKSQENEKKNSMMDNTLNSATTTTGNTPKTTTTAFPPRFCGISAMMGTYEKSPKEPAEKLNPSAPLFMFTDREDLLAKKDSAWTFVRSDPSIWQEDCQRFRGARNDPCNNTHPFNLAKFYKEQFYRLPALREAGCNVVAWMDADVQIANATFVAQLESRARRGQNFVVFIHDKPRKGILRAEVHASTTTKVPGRKTKKYFSTTWIGLPQPWQPVDKQYEYYLSQGFREKWFNANDDQHREAYGVFHTGVVMFDLRQPITRDFLDCWWHENLNWTTQDQISFPYCVWKLGIHVDALPDAETWGMSKNNPLFRKVGHFKRR